MADAAVRSWLGWRSHRERDADGVLRRDRCGRIIDLRGAIAIGMKGDLRRLDRPLTPEHHSGRLALIHRAREAFERGDKALEQ